MSPPLPRRTFRVCSQRFQVNASNVLDAVLTACTIMVEKVVYIIGPALIGFASVIIYALANTFFTIVVPMLQLYYHQAYSPMLATFMLSLHILWVIFLLLTIVFNYFMCVTTRNTGPNYQRVVRELAKATNIDYPETPQALQAFRQNFEDRMLLRMRRRQARAAEQRDNHEQQRQQNQKRNESVAATSVPQEASTTDLELATPSTLTSTIPSATSSTTLTRQRKPTSKQPFPRAKLQPSPVQVRAWMLMAPDEWGYCPRSKQPKPPRSHYDHVTKTLILCLDHYCPWMFNAIGYFNYRYFCNFLWFVQIGMLYGAAVTYRPWYNMGGPLYKAQVQQFKETGQWKRMFPMVPLPSERMPLSLTFMLCLAIGIAVSCLGGFHLYLVLTGQTTIEFHGNWMQMRKAKREGRKYQNPYDLGYQRNFGQVFGEVSGYGSALRAIMVPSGREPEFLPLPIPGDEGRRRTYQTLQQAVGKDEEQEPLTKEENIV